MYRLCITLLLVGVGILRAGSVEIDSPVQTEFGVYEPVSVARIVPNAPQPTVADDLSNVLYLETLESSLDENALAILKANHFVALKSQFKQPHDLYNYLAKNEYPQFVTTDAMLHTFHILYDYCLRIMETETFQYDLSALNEALAGRLEERASENAELSEELIRARAFVAVAQTLQEPGFVPDTELEQLVASEVALASDHEGIFESPILGYREDYSQYVSRGHYTRSEELGRYFMAMMWYGRLGFRLRPGDSEELIEKGRSETRMALNIVSALSQATVKGEPAIDVWERIYRPTVFFVGSADDLTFYDYFDLAESVYGKPVAELSADEIADPALLDEFISKAAEFRKPRINSSVLGDGEDAETVTQGFRVMGQRFIPDSYVFWQLVYPNVNDRLFPRGLDAMSVLGSGLADKLLDEHYSDTSIPSYSEKLQELKDEFESLPEETWAENLYWNWLYCLKPLLEEKDNLSGYPQFMQGALWKVKALITALGSWAELRHDTILYAKQSYTGETSIPMPPEKVTGYVEPEPEVYARLAALARFMRQGFAERGILPEDIEWRLRDFESFQLALKLISEKELSGESISDTGTDVISTVGERLEKLVTFDPEDGGWESDTDENMAVIADVHTDPNSSQALEVGVGYPMYLFVIVPGESGPVLSVGAMFSYYEFKQPISDRLTDEQWQKMLTDSPAPEMLDWSLKFVGNPDETLETYYSFQTSVPQLSGPYLQINADKVQVGESFEISAKLTLVADYSVKFWDGDNLLGQINLEFVGDGIWSASVPTDGWPEGAVVRAEFIKNIDSVESLYIETSAAILNPGSGDINNDGELNIFDLLDLLQGLSTGNGSDLNNDGSIDIFDLLDLLGMIVSSNVGPATDGSESIRLTGLGSCNEDESSSLASSRGLVPASVEDVLSFEVDTDGSVRGTHPGPMFNCCMDSLGLKMSIDGNHITVTETEHTANPCRCVCAQDVYFELTGLDSGNYTVDIVSADNPDQVSASGTFSVE